MVSATPYDAVLFDCDSTLSAIEGIDELARQAGLYDKLAPLTAAAMEGKLSLEAVYRQRLDAIRPTLAAVAALGECYIRHVVPGAGEVIAALQQSGKRVHIVSGGLRQAVLPLAAYLAWRRKTSMPWTSISTKKANTATSTKPPPWPAAAAKPWSAGKWRSGKATSC